MSVIVQFLDACSFRFECFDILGLQFIDHLESV